MMTYQLSHVAAVLTLCTASAAYAFELTTHQKLSEAAVGESALVKNPLVLKDLGLDFADAPAALPFNGARQSVREIMVDGARLEDTLTRSRPINHFLDPTRAGDANNGAARGVVSVLNPSSSPTWALADRGTVNGQENSFRNARSYLLNALTLGPKTERETAFTQTFQTLGMVIHHLQDMAQPQHVRNDLHCPEDICKPFFHNPSAYESYTERQFASINAVPVITGYPSVYAGANTSILNSPRTLWYTGDGKGIAEFTNRNFVSDGTNFRYDRGNVLPDAQYGSPLPLPSTAISIQEAYQTRKLNPGEAPQQIKDFCGDNCWIEFYATSSGVDSLTGQSVINTKASSLSMFDHDLKLKQIELSTSDSEKKYSTERVFSLNSFNFDAANDILLRRAVGYSAGLIDYFFRGKLDAEPQGPGALLVKNLSTEAMQGDFGLYYDDAQGSRHPVAITACRIGASDVPVDQGKCKSAPLVSVSADPNARLSVTFDAPISPSPKNLGEFMLVFNGNLGEERADSAPGAVGAVVGKLVSNPYNGVLYIAGEDSARRLRFFKIDRGGISDITGFNPLEALFFNQAPREKAYLLKQAVVTVAPSGTLLHKTVALATRRSNTLGDLSFVSDPVSGTLRPVGGIAWTAQSPDPTVGSFEFGLSIIDFAGRQANLFYTRRFTNAQGQPAQTTGVLRLPDLPTNAGYFYSDFSKGVLMLNGDGTEIYPRGSAPFRRYGVRITLAGTPTAALFDLPQGTSSFTSKPATSTSTSLGQCSVDYLGILPNGQTVPMTTSSTHSRFESVARDQENTSESMVIEDFTGGELLTYLNRSRGRQFESTVTETCEAKALDWTIFGNPRAKVNVLHRQQAQRIFRVVNEHVLREGSLQHVTTNVKVRPADAGYSCGVGVGPVAVAIWVFSNSYVDLNYSHNGFAPCPIQTADEYVSGDDPANPKKRIYRALTHHPRDAVYSDQVQGPTGGLFSVTKFRDDTLVPGAGFIADASPIGEVFLAKPDLSLIVHEPKLGNMPVLTRELIPSGIVTLLAAVWM